MEHGELSVFLCGDVMLGRGVDQILPEPAAPALREHYVRDATYYVRAAEAANGPIPHPVAFEWPWGHALPVLDTVDPDVRVINLESAITRDDSFLPGKPVHYRMEPANLPTVQAARPDVCVLANNHILDFGHAGLAETFDSLSQAGMRWAGAGTDAAEAARPVAVAAGEQGRVVVLAYGADSSGIPADWAATPQQSGINFLPDLSETTATEIINRVTAVKRPGDIALVSIHWGSNWGFPVPRAQVRFARTLIDGGVDLVHGHSAHHPRPIEVYRERLILYGCGDCINDYEGISGTEQYRDDLRLLYFATVEPGSGRLSRLRMAPFRANRMSLEPATPEETRWLRKTLTRISAGFGTRVSIDPEGMLIVSS